MKKTQMAVRPKPVKMWVWWNPRHSKPSMIWHSEPPFPKAVEKHLVQVTITRDVRGKTTNKRKES